MVDGKPSDNGLRNTGNGYTPYLKERILLRLVMSRYKMMKEILSFAFHVPVEAKPVAGLLSSPEKMPGRIFLFLFLAAVCRTAEVGEDYTDKTLLEMARNDVDEPIHLEASVDGRPLQPHYVESAFFEVDIPAHPIFEVFVNRGRHRAASAGFWHKLDPLPSGMHVIRFGGTGRNGFHTAVAYSVRILSSALGHLNSENSVRGVV